MGSEWNFNPSAAENYTLTPISTPICLARLRERVRSRASRGERVRAYAAERIAAAFTLSSTWVSYCLKFASNRLARSRATLS